MSQKPKIAFFGGEPLGVPALQKLHEAGIVPELIVCSPDRPAGRGHKLTPPPVKTWAEEHKIEVFQPLSYKNKEELSRITDTEWDLFIVVAYNFIMPKWLIELPKKGTINVHPSLLPKLRGASPIRTAILENLPEHVGVTIMLMDEKMDHGPILAQEKVEMSENWPTPGPDLDTLLADKGGELLAETTTKWLSDEINPIEQNHEEATYTKKFLKPDNEILIDPNNLPTGDEAYELLCKINAWSGIGDTYFIHDGKRIKVKTATLSSDGKLQILSIIPEGKKETEFNTYF